MLYTRCTSSVMTRSTSLHFVCNPASNSAVRSNQQLRLQFSMQTSSASDRQRLHVELTDDQDPFFYYSLDIDEIDFTRCALLLSFSIMPYMEVASRENKISRLTFTRFRSILELCLRDALPTSVQAPRRPCIFVLCMMGLTLSSVRYLLHCVLPSSGTRGHVLLSVVETNAFRNLTHIQLK